MKVTRVEKNKGKQYSLDLELSEREVAYLVNLALDYLVEKGWVEYQAQDESAEEIRIKILETMPDHGFFHG